MDPVTDDYAAVTRIFAALASPVRSAIVHLLTERPHTVTEISAVLGASQPLVSQHLKVLREAGLVDSERAGRSIHYAIADEHVSHVFLDALIHTQEPNHD